MTRINKTYVNHFIIIGIINYNVFPLYGICNSIRVQMQYRLL